MKHRCAVNLDHVQTVRKVDLRRYLTTLDEQTMDAACRALAVATSCSTIASARSTTR
jgi:mRNA-degrading endonuclease toxin of MazEF toxin-antitoxin module